MKILREMAVDQLACPKLMCIAKSRISGIGVGNRLTISPSYAAIIKRGMCKACAYIGREQPVLTRSIVTKVLNLLTFESLKKSLRVSASYSDISAVTITRIKSASPVT